MALVMAVPLGSPPAAAAGPHVSVLVDFGDGTYLWTNVTLPSENVTALRATELANGTWGLPPLNVTWFDSAFCLRRPCALVNDIGDRRPVYPTYWHFFLWNNAALRWDPAPYGPSDTDLSEGESMAWYLAVDDPSTFASPAPVPTPIFPDVWTSFRGDLSNTGHGHGAIPVTNAVLWDRDVGVLEVDTTPVVAYGRVFVATRGGLVALDAATGEQVWRNPQVHDLLSTPAVYNGHLILGGTDGRLHCVDASNGTEEWSVLLEPGARSTGIASSPAVYMGRAYLGTFNETVGGKGRVVAVNLNNGTIAWSYDAPGAIHMSQPAIRGGNLYVGVMGVYDGDVGYAPPYGLLSLTLDGAFRWFFATNGSVASSPLMDGERVYFTAKEPRIYALWSNGTVAWVQDDLIVPSTSSPVLVGSVLFVAAGELSQGNGTVGYMIERFDSETGERSSPFPWPSGGLIVFGAVQASLVSDGRLVCSAVNLARGWHLCFTTDFDAAWTYTPVPNQYILGTPTIAGNTLYATSDNGHVYAFRDDPAKPALASITAMSFEPPLSTGGAGSVLTFTVRALDRGRVENATVHVQIGPGLQLKGESREAASRPREVSLDIGGVDPNGTKYARVNVTWVTPSQAWFLNWSLTYEDLAGRSYSTGWTRASEGPSLPSYDTWILVAAVAVPWALVVVFLLVRRWRMRRAS